MHRPLEKKIATGPESKLQSSHAHNGQMAQLKFHESKTLFSSTPPKRKIDKSFLHKYDHRLHLGAATFTELESFGVAFRKRQTNPILFPENKPQDGFICQKAKINIIQQFTLRSKTENKTAKQQHQLKHNKQSGVNGRRQQRITQPPRIYPERAHAHNTHTQWSGKHYRLKMMRVTSRRPESPAAACLKETYRGESSSWCSHAAQSSPARSSLPMKTPVFPPTDPSGLLLLIHNENYILACQLRGHKANFNGVTCFPLSHSGRCEGP